MVERLHTEVAPWAEESGRTRVSDRNTPHHSMVFQKRCPSIYASRGGAFGRVCWKLGIRGGQTHTPCFGSKPPARSTLEACIRSCGETRISTSFKGFVGSEIVR